MAHLTRLNASDFSFVFRRLRLSLPAITTVDMKRALTDLVTRYGREFRRRNPEIKEQVASVRAAVAAADEVDAAFVRDQQLVSLLLHGCYTKQVPIVSASLHAFLFLASHRLLVDSDLQLVVQVLLELTDSNLRLREIGSTALECCLGTKTLAGASLGRAIGVCVRQQCALADMHRLIALVIDRTGSQGAGGSPASSDDGMSTISLSFESRPPAHSMDQARGDAFALVQDLVLLSLRGRRPQWLHRVRRTSHLLTFDVLAYTLAHQPTLFLLNPYFEKFLTRKIFDLIADSVGHAIAGDYGDECSFNRDVEKAQEAGTESDESDEDEEEDEDTETEEDAEEAVVETKRANADSVYLRLVVICELLVRNFASMDRFRGPCSALLEQLLRSAMQATRNEKAILLKSWANLLASCCAAWPDRDAVEAVLFPPYLTEVVAWLCEELHACQRRTIVDSAAGQARKDSVTMAQEVHVQGSGDGLGEAVIAFRRNVNVTYIRQVSLTSGISWNSEVQAIQFDDAEYLYIVLMSVKTFLISLNTCLGDATTRASLGLTRLISVACAGGTRVLEELVQQCVDRQTDQTLALALETTLDLSGRGGHDEACVSIVQVHTNLINQSIDRLQDIVREQSALGEGPVNASVSDLSHRIAQFGICLLHLASTYPNYIGDSWPDVCDVLFRLHSLFDFPFFKAGLHYDSQPLAFGGDSCGSSVVSMVSLVCEETTDVRRDLDAEIDNFSRKSSCYPDEVLRQILSAFFANLKDKIKEEKPSAVEDENEGDLYYFTLFTISKVSELAIYNLERFHTFGKEWFASFISLFFQTLGGKVESARLCFYVIVRRLIVSLDTGSCRPEHCEQVESMLVTALYHFEQLGSPELMSLQISCIQRLVERYVDFPPAICHQKSLTAIPDLLKRHAGLKHQNNVEFAFAVFQDFPKSQAIRDPKVRRECCERSLNLSIALLGQQLSMNTAIETPDAMRSIYKVIREGDIDRDPSFEQFLLSHVSQLEVFSRDKNPKVRREAAYLLFDVLSGEEVRSSVKLFFDFIQSVVTPGLAEIVADLKKNKDDEQKVENYSNYVVNVATIILRRYIDTKDRASLLPCALWSQVFDHLREAIDLSIDPIAFSVLYSLRMLSESLREVTPVDQEQMTLRRMLWCHATELTTDAVEKQKISEVLLPDTVHLLEEVFLAQFLSLDSSDVNNLCDLVFRLVRDRAMCSASELGNGNLRKERRLLSLIKTVSRQLLDSSDKEHEEIACDLLFRLANISLERVAAANESLAETKKDVKVTWPVDHYQIYEKTAFCLMTEEAEHRIVNKKDNRPSLWLKRCLNICETANKFQYMCSHIGIWQAVHSCFSFAIDSLTRDDLLTKDSEEAETLADEYEKALKIYLFSPDKNSRFISSSDFLEHQNGELEVLDKIQIFITAAQWGNEDQSSTGKQLLRSRLTRGVISELANVANTQAADMILNSTRIGPSIDEEFCDSRQWRFQASCIKALVFLMNWSLDHSSGQNRECEVDIINRFNKYAIEAFVRFRERLEVRAEEPLPSVVYFEISTILATVKSMLQRDVVDAQRRRSVVILYPYVVDVILLCKGRLLPSILDVLHAYKSIMHPAELKR